MSRIMQHVAAVLVAVLITTTTFTTVVRVPAAPGVAVVSAVA